MLDSDFFQRDGLTIAKSILGKYLIRRYDEIEIVTKIVETEAYMGVEDKGAHVYGDKRTKRTEPLYLSGGHIYVYMIYGMYYCLNISANIKDVPQCVLIRAVEPITNLEEISNNRYNKLYKDLSYYQMKNITNGPGKLCSALKINKTLSSKYINKSDLYISDYYIKDGSKVFSDNEINIVSSKRINIDYAQEAKDYYWRFYISNNKFVSCK